MLGLKNSEVHNSGDGWSPVYVTPDGNEQDVGVNGFKPMLAKWDQHPDRDNNWATEERGRIGEERFKREHECEFIIYDETLIDPLKLVTLK